MEMLGGRERLPQKEQPAENLASELHLEVLTGEVWGLLSPGNIWQKLT